MLLQNLIRLLYTLLFLTVALISNAQVTVWTGFLNTSWNHPLNWSHGIPNAISHVIIPPSNNDPILTSVSATIRSLHIQNGATFTVSDIGPGLSLFPFVGICILNEGTLNINGSVEINGGTQPIFNGISNSNTCNLSGTLTINAVGTGIDDEAILNDGQFNINGGTLNIGNLANIDGNGITNNGDFVINSGSSVIIDRNEREGINNRPDGTFTNFGTIKIGTISSIFNASNTAINNQGNFSSSSEIEIQDATLHGIVNQEMMTLNGNVKITNSGPVGLYNFASDSDISLQSGIKLDIFNQITDSFLGIKNQGSFNLGPGGEANIESSGDGIENNKSFFVTGKMTINTTPGLQNDAIENNDFFILVSPCDAMIHITSNAPINNSSVFINDGLIKYDGTKASNISLNREVVVSTQGDHVSIDSDEGFYISENKSIWTGCQNSDWLNTDNWVESQVPDATDDVLLTDHGSNHPQINSMVNVASILVGESSILNITSSGDLNCLGSSENSLSIFGDIINNGFIRISNNPANTGIDCHGSLTNNTLIIIKECQIGIKNEGSFSVNEFGNLLIDDTGTDGIVNNGIFSSTGQITFGSFAALGGNAVVNNNEFTIGTSCRALLDVKTNNPVVDNSNFVNGGVLNYNGNQNSNIHTNNGFVVSKQGDFVAITIDNGVYAPDDFVVWTGCENEFWSDPRNWTNTLSPQSTDHVLIPVNTQNNPILNNTTTIASLQIALSASLHITQGNTLNLIGTDQNSIEADGQLLNQGTTNISNNPDNHGIRSHDTSINW